MDGPPLQPGKLIWVVGVSCAGKSTVAQMLAREKGYVYYEADCVTMLCNPFPDLGADNLYDALMTSRPLKGWSRDVVFKQKSLAGSTTTTRG